MRERIGGRAGDEKGDSPGAAGRSARTGRGRGRGRRASCRPRRRRAHGRAEGPGPGPGRPDPSEGRGGRFVEVEPLEMRSEIFLAVFCCDEKEGGKRRGGGWPWGVGEK